MPEVIFPGPEGRLEGRFNPGPRPRAPVAMILHPHPQGGGTMNNRIVQSLYQTFTRRGFATLRFNFRGVGKSQGVFDNGVGELSDAASALDWVQSIHPEAQTTWIAGFSFGAWIGMQLLMRRPEIKGFISIAPPANMYDFTFLAPCPSSGIIIQGTGDEVVTSNAVQKLVDKLRTQRHITIHHDEIRGANHFFEHEQAELMSSVDRYLDMRLAPEFADPVRSKDMADEELAYDESTKRLYLDLFTEIAIIEHLVRERFEPAHLADLVAADFGVLNHFVRLGKTTEKLKTLAWCFQVEMEAMRATVATLAGRRLVELDWVDGFECVFITDSGRTKHAEAVADMAPDIIEIMSEFQTSDLETTTATLKEIRRTFDNLPDR